MKNKVRSMVLACFAILFSFQIVLAKDFSAKTSTLTWKGKKVTGEHFGKIAIKSASFSEKKGILTDAKVEIDMNSITCEDMQDADYNKKLVDHLKNPDFFDTEKHPTASLKLTSLTPATEANTFNAKAQITLKGISNEISFPLTLKISNSKISANGTLKIDRTKFGIKYGSGSFFEGLGDKMIYDDFEITFSIDAE